MKLILTNGEHIHLSAGYPENFPGPFLRSANAFTAQSALAELTIQELTGDEYTIRLTVGKILKKITTRDWIQRTGLYSSFMLKNGMFKELGNIGKFHLRQDQHSCYFTPPTSCGATFEKPHEFRLLEVFYSPSLLNELTPYFPELVDYLQSSSGGFLTQKTVWTFPKLKEIYQQILDCPYDSATRQFYLDLKVRELLFHLLEKAFLRNPKEISFTAFEVARIHEAKNILELHMDKKPPSIRALSRQVAINEFKLKNGFKKYFGVGIFEWLLERKMRYAKELILTTNKPIKEISALIGYPRTTNFITAFRRTFGMTPGSLRRS